MTSYNVHTELGALQLKVASVSHTGMVRAVNEDSVLAEPPVFAVADGMGGHSFGDRASATAVLALTEEFEPGQAIDPEHVFSAIRRANSAVRALTAEGAAGTHLIAGTTLAGVALVVERPGAEPRWMVFNLGDSRVYGWDASAQQLARISVDHSLVQELLDAGLIDEEGARRHPDRNVITRALGAANDVQPEAWLLPATRAQTFLICSDGLTKELDDTRIAELLAPTEPDDSLDGAVDRLLEGALAAGGADNISLVLLRAEYSGSVANPSEVDEQTRERGLSVLSPELDDTRPRV